MSKKSRKPASRSGASFRRPAPSPSAGDLWSVLDAFSRAGGCPECGADHLHDLTLAHVLHADDLRPAQRDAAIALLSAGVAGDSLFRSCCRCDYSSSFAGKVYL